MNWDNQVALDLLPKLGQAFLVIVEATLGATVICLVLGLVCAIALRSGPPIVRIPLFGVLEFIRNTPLLVQLFFAYLISLSLVEMTQTSRLILGMVVLGIHYTTYTSEVYRSGIDGVPKGQWEAITALSLPKRYAWQHVILPQALRRVVPALGNYIISMFKEVPALTVIGVAEMISTVKAYQVEFLTGYVEGFTIAGLIFLAVSYPIAVAMRKLEKRLGN